MAEDFGTVLIRSGVRLERKRRTRSITLADISGDTVITIECPKCAEKFKTEVGQLDGKRANCPFCRTNFTVKEKDLIQFRHLLKPKRAASERLPVTY